MNAQTKIVPVSRATGDMPVRYRLRVTDYLLLDAQGSFQDKETELVDGEVFFMSPEWRPHYRIKSELTHRLHDAVRKAGLSYFVGSEGSIALSDTDMPRPDVSLTSDPTGDGAIPVASVPLVVEISSTTIEADLNIKAPRYAAANVPEYWIVDVNARVIYRMSEPADGAYTKIDEIKFGQLLCSVTLAELAIETTGL